MHNPTWLIPILFILEYVASLLYCNVKVMAYYNTLTFKYDSKRAKKSLQIKQISLDSPSFQVTQHKSQAWKYIYFVLP